MTASAAALEPLHTQNLSPYTALLGVPRWDLVATAGDSWRLRVDLDLANHFAASSSGTETVILDGETMRSTLVLRRRFGEAWLFGLDVPYVRHSGGFLDSFIDRWHDTFGLPDGGRDLRPRDLLQYEYRLAGVGSSGLASDQSGIGDITLVAARSVGASGLEVHAQVKLPTGDAERFTGSGGTDIGVSIRQQRPRAEGQRWRGIYWGAGLIRLDEGDLTLPEPEDWLVVGLIGSAFQLTRRVNLMAQLELHSAPYDSSVEELGDPSAQLTFGARIAVASALSLDLALSEDVLTNSAPDVAFHVGLVWDW